MTKLGWKLDLTKCVGCHTCSIACKAENNTYPQSSPLEIKGINVEKVNYREVLEIESGVFPTPSKEFVSMSCNHCDEPACLKACPVDAISKRESDGIVLIDQDKCIGCKYCSWACPYGAPQFNKQTKKVEKCTFCVHRIDEGLMPACVTACVGKALTIEEDVEDVGKAPAGFADPTLTKPKIHFER